VPLVPRARAAAERMSLLSVDYTRYPGKAPGRPRRAGKARNARIARHSGSEIQDPGPGAWKKSPDRPCALPSDRPEPETEGREADGGGHDSAENHKIHSRRLA
jgi:hypothetical protein